MTFPHVSSLVSELLLAASTASLEFVAKHTWNAFWTMSIFSRMLWGLVAKFWPIVYTEAIATTSSDSKADHFVYFSKVVMQYLISTIAIKLTEALLWGESIMAEFSTRTCLESSTLLSTVILTLERTFPENSLNLFVSWYCLFFLGLNRNPWGHHWLFRCMQLLLLTSSVWMEWLSGLTNLSTWGVGRPVIQLPYSASLLYSLNK
jgi:hypothetical protein